MAGSVRCFGLARTLTLASDERLLSRCTIYMTAPLAPIFFLLGCANRACPPPPCRTALTLVPRKKRAAKVAGACNTHLAFARKRVEMTRQLYDE